MQDVSLPSQHFLAPRHDNFKLSIPHMRVNRAKVCNHLYWYIFYITSGYWDFNVLLRLLFSHKQISHSKLVTSRDERAVADECLQIFVNLYPNLPFTFPFPPTFLHKVTEIFFLHSLLELKKE